MGVTIVIMGRRHSGTTGVSVISLGEGPEIERGASELPAKVLCAPGGLVTRVRS